MPRNITEDELRRGLLSNDLFIDFETAEFAWLAFPELRLSNEQLDYIASRLKGCKVFISGKENGVVDEVIRESNWQGTNYQYYICSTKGSSNHFSKCMVINNFLISCGNSSCFMVEYTDISGICSKCKNLCKVKDKKDCVFLEGRK